MFANVFSSLAFIISFNIPFNKLVVVNSPRSFNKQQMKKLVYRFCNILNQFKFLLESTVENG